MPHSPQPPDPGQAGCLDDFVDGLRRLKVWAGDPSYERITDRVNSAWSAAGRPAAELTGKTTVVDCFRPGRRRLNSDLVLAVVEALHPDVGYVSQWRQALRVVGGEARAAAQVRVQDTLPPELAGFTGRRPELDQLCRVIRPIGAIEGMAGVGKTQLAVQAGHILLREKEFDRLLFVNLRGFHPDPAQPSADPAAVLDGFLRLLGTPGQQIPHDLQARVAAYRRRLTGTRTLVILDNAAAADQVRPLLPDTPGCLTLITSRRFLELDAATHLIVDAFTPEEAGTFLNHSVPGVPAGADPNAPARIAGRCGYLPLALSLVAAHIRGTPGWTLTDHADRLDERHLDRRLDGGVELALDLSYQCLPAEQRRLLRLAALHPGQDLDAHAAAALAGLDRPTVREHLRHLGRDHLLQPVTRDRYALHDLVRAYAAARAADEDPPPQRRAALTRLLDHYLATAATAMDVVYPFERHRRPAVPRTPEPVGRDSAVRWLDIGLANLLSAAQHAAANGWPQHAWQLSAVLDRHLHARGRLREAETLHRQALELARHHGDATAELNALNGLGYVDRMLGRYERAGDNFERALRIAQDIGDRGGEMHALVGLDSVYWWLGRYAEPGDHDKRTWEVARATGDHYERSLAIAQEIGDRSGERTALHCLGHIQLMQGRYKHAGDYFDRALVIAREIGDHGGELVALNSLGHIHHMLGHFEVSAVHFGQAVPIAELTGDRGAERYALTGLGHTTRRLGRPELADDHYRAALRIALETGDRVGELQALRGIGEVHLALGRYGEAFEHHGRLLALARELGNGNWEFEGLQALGRVHQAVGQHGLALTHHEQALRCATELGQPADQARAYDGLAHAHYALNELEPAGRHWQRALDILIDLGLDHSEEPEVSISALRAWLAALKPRAGSA